jgi:hypothetical protein
MPRRRSLAGPSENLVQKDSRKLAEYDRRQAELTIASTV